jgi:hypothetical protein
MLNYIPSLKHYSRYILDHLGLLTSDNHPEIFLLKINTIGILLAKVKAIFRSETLPTSPTVDVKVTYVIVPALKVVDGNVTVC